MRAGRLRSDRAYARADLRLCCSHIRTVPVTRDIYININMRNLRPAVFVWRVFNERLKTAEAAK